MQRRTKLKRIDGRQSVLELANVRLDTMKKRQRTAAVQNASEGKDARREKIFSEGMKLLYPSAADDQVVLIKHRGLAGGDGALR